MIKLTEEVLVRARSFVISGRSKELSLALLASCHSRNPARVSQDDEVSLCHEAERLSQNEERCHCKKLRPLRCSVMRFIFRMAARWGVVFQISWLLRWRSHPNTSLAPPPG